MTICDIEAAGIGLGIWTAAVICSHYLGKTVKYFLDDDAAVPSIIIGFVSALVIVLSIVLLIIIIGGLFDLGHFILGC